MGDAEALSAQLEEAVQLYEEQLAEKDDQLAELRERTAQLEEELVGEGRGGDLELRDEVREVRARLEQAEDELERAMDAAKGQENRARELDLQNKALKMDKLKLESELQKEQERAESMEENLHTMRQRTEQAAEHEGRLGAREKNHKKTLIKALGENEQLRSEVAQLGTDIETLYQAVNEKDEEIQRLNNLLTASGQELKDTESEVEELKRLIVEKDKAIAAAHDEINAVTEMESEIEERVKTKVEKWKQKVKDLQGELQSERKAQVDLQKKCDSLLLESGLREVEQQLVASEENAKTMAQQLDEARGALDAAHQDMLELARENETMKADQGKFIDIALEKEKAEIDRLRQVITHKDQLLEEERARYRELDEQKAALEEELQDREFTLAEYERGHGLSEAVLKQKKLKGDIKRRDKEIRRLNQALSERIAAHEKLYETCRRLKKKAGVPEAFQYDDLELEEGMKGQTERLQALIRELEGQNEALEDERLRLLEALRVNAANMGDKGMKLYGLTADQVIQVNQFVENLREGRVELPLDDRSLQLKEEIRELKQRLRDAERDLAAAELQLEGHLPTAFASDRGADGDSSFDNSDTDDDDVGENGALRNSSRRRQKRRHHHRYARGEGDNDHEHIERLAREQHAMMAEIKSDIQRTIADFMHAQHQDDSHHSHKASPHRSSRSPRADPGYEKLMQMLQTKLEGGASDDGPDFDRGQVESMRNELERQSSMNDQLVRRLQDAEAIIERVQRTGLRSPGSAGHSHAPRAHRVSTALEKPSGLAAQQFAEQQLTQYRLPPEEWTEPLILANNRLTACMERLMKKERENARLQESLGKYATKIETHAAQMALLYREHAQAKQAWTRETSGLRKEADEARGERDALRAKARRLDTLCAVLDGDDHDARTHAKDLTRKVALLEVNEVVLARRYNLVVEEERSVRHEKESLQHEMVQAETALRERVLYLEEWKAGAQAQLDAMQTSMDRLVPRDAHEQVVRKLATTNHKYRDLLGREAQLRGRTSGAQALRRRVHELETELELLRAESTRAKKEAIAVKEQFDWLQQRSKGEGSVPDQADVLQQVAKFKGEAVEKEIVLASVMKKTAILEKRASELQAELHAEAQRGDQAEQALESAREVIKKIEQELSEARERYHGGATREERKVLDTRISELEAMFGALSREADRFRELADIATTQVQAFEATHSSRQQELEALRQQLRDVNARSDDDAIIGKLQHELTTTKVSYQLFVRKFEKAKATARRYELQLRKQEAQLDEKDRVLHQTREQVRRRILALEGALEQVGVPHGAATTSDVMMIASSASATASSAMPGAAASMSSMVRLSEMITRLGESAEQSEEALRRSEASRRNLESEVEAMRIEVQASATAMEDLKQRVLSEGRVAHGTEQGEDGQTLAHRLLQLNENLKAAQLESMRQRREVQLLREEKEHLEKLRARDEEHILRLEESVANTENTLRRYEDERRIRSASKALVDDDNLGVHVPQELEDDTNENENALGLSADAAQPHLSSQAQAVDIGALRELRLQLQEAQDREDRLERQVQVKVEQVRLLQNRLRAEGLPDDPEDLELDGENDNEYASGTSRRTVQERASHLYEADARKIQAAAQQSVASFKDIIARKNQAIEALKKKLELERKGALVEKERDQAEIERLTEKLYEDNRDAIHKLRTAYEDISKGAIPGSDGDGDAQQADAAFHRDMMDRLEEADVLLERKDRRILELEGMVEELQILRGKAEDRAGQSAEIAETLREKVRRLASQSETQGAKQLVKQLRGQLAAKENTLVGLRSAVLALKTEFVKAEEEHEQDLIKRDRAMNALSANSKSSAANGASRGQTDENQPDMGNVRDQIDALRERVERSQEDLDNTKRREEKLRAENSKLRRQLHEQADEVELRAEDQSRTGADATKLQRKIDELRRENRRLRENLHNAQATQAVGAIESKTPEGKPKHDEVPRLEKRIKVLEAQNAALRSAAKTAASKSDAALSSGQDSGAASSTWEAGKRLEKKVSVLQRRLEERTRELEASREQTQQAKHLVDKMSRQVRSARGPPSGHTAWESNGSVSQAHEGARKLRRELEDARRELEDRDDRMLELRRQVEVEFPSQLAQVNADRRASMARARDLEEELESFRLRKRHRSSGADSLQIAEDQYGREDEIRQQLAQVRKEAQGLESDLLDRDNTILELRFEMEQLSSEVERCRRDDESKLPSSGTSPSSRGATSRAPGERFKRERDLENVVESMKKVVSKLQAENERLKRTHTSSARYGDLQKQVRALKQENQALVSARDTLQDRAVKYSESSAKAIRLQDAVRGLRRQTRALETDVEKERARATALWSENQKLVEELQQASDRLSARVPRLEAGRDQEVDDLRRKVREQTRVIDALRLEVSAATDLGPGAGAVDEDAREALEDLRAENQRLKNELNAFDMDFFEEIEDLKYRYQQATEDNARLRARLLQA
ncbi:Centrosomal protein of 290 kDa [Hondaea fermentalgiana]|uniref:Centrosomal protein of 290 kDa n=1 Tax=Hondaea fermentalgiana TaxID=2315210 RepID=A0A2R5G9X9_9STRA|nr:Centrosomal protein of 290 kDa [Hondaea fermentalgiana]|eukprot:GBG27827.1 Centrosomal protein of 290 kDa [Hondaea fermentalgiana]